MSLWFFIYCFNTITITLMICRGIRRHPENWEPLPKSGSYIFGYWLALMMWPLTVLIAFYWTVRRKR